MIRQHHASLATFILLAFANGSVRCGTHRRHPGRRSVRSRGVREIAEALYRFAELRGEAVRRGRQQLPACSPADIEEELLYACLACVGPY